jgi:hypothetical protein
MTLEQATQELREIMAVTGGNTAPPFALRQRIDALYWAMCRKHLPNCKCRDRVADALAEIYHNIKKGINMSVNKATLRRGVLIWHKGKPYTVSNITDEVAREYLAEYPQNKGYFEILPEPAEVKEEPAESKEEKPAETKKTSKKAKK